ncbi:MAG: DUF4230 domain-containing protein [Prochlorotrichaceae cyanobacterium]
MLKRLGNIAIGGVLMVGVFTLLGVWRSGNNLFQAVGNWFTAPQPAAEIDVRSVMINKIRGANELATGVFGMEAVVPTKRYRTLGNLTVGTTTLLYIAYGDVRAGVDLSQLAPSDIQIRAETIQVTLPPPQILDAKIDVTRSSVYDYDRGFLGLGPDSAPELQTLAGQAALNKIIEVACKQNILAQANDRAKLAVGQLLSSVAEKTLSIQTQAVDPLRCVLPPAPSESPSSDPSNFPGAPPGF